MTDSPLKGGRAIDPSQGLDARMDVAVQDGAISEIAPNIKPGPRYAGDKCGRQAGDARV